MFKAVEFPASVAHLDTGLSNVDGNDLSHVDGWCVESAKTKRIKGLFRSKRRQKAEKNKVKKPTVNSKE